MDSRFAKYKYKKSPFTMGWLVLMFDLPTTTKLDQRRATQLRKALLDDGYSMMQYSIYMRFCSSKDKMSKHVARLSDVVPTGGNVRVVFITDKQWEKSIAIIGKRYAKEKSYITIKQPQLFEEW